MSITKSDAASSTSNKIKMLIEVLAVFGAALGMMWATNMIPAFETWQRDLFRCV